MLQEEKSPYPVLKITGGEDLLHGEDLIVMADGCTLTKDVGTMDCIMGILLLYSVYWIYGFQYPETLKKTFAFFDAFVFELNSQKTVPVSVLRLHTELTCAHYKD